MASSIRASCPYAIGVFFLILLCILLRDDPSIHAAFPTFQVVSRSHLSNGDLTRLQRVLAKARRGEPVTIGFIGGSITRGEQATTPNQQYDHRVLQWWIDQFPNTQFTLVNAGVSGTSSMYGCLRVQRDLISKHPDLVVVEFGVNDPNPPPNLEPDPDGAKAKKNHDAQIHAQTYEGVIRQLMADPDEPAVVELFMMHKDGTNAQDAQSEIGNRYRLPMISFRDALWPEFRTGHLRREDYFNDTVHPNNRGHAAIASFINSLLQQTLDHLPGDAAIPAVNSSLPDPVFTDLYAHTTLIDAGNIKPMKNNGWTYDSANDWWVSSGMGSTIEFEVTGQSVDFLYQKQDGGTAVAVLTVDGHAMPWLKTLLVGWGPLTQVDRLEVDSKSPKHRVRIQLMVGKTLLTGASAGEFRILGFGTATPKN